jgi:hypothetical protein
MNRGLEKLFRRTERKPSPRGGDGTSARTGGFQSMLMKHLLLLFGVMVSASSVAVAQAPPTPVTPPAQTAPPAPIRSSDCAPTKPMPQQGTVSPEGSTIGQRTEPLGDKLARSDGVLCPPTGVDPEIRAPTPDTGSNMPVIPPPGSPGGDPERPAEIVLADKGSSNLNCVQPW